MNASTSSLYDLPRPQLDALLEDEPSYRLDQLWSGLYREHKPLEEITTLPKALRAKLAELAPTALELVEQQQADRGQTIKWLWKLAGDHQLETVLMHYPDRATVCVSSQAGCAMACSFCATGQAGFDRHLTTGEIVEQVIRAARASGDKRVSNVVFMGMGEPLANFDNTWAAVERMHGAMGIGARSLTMSTVGLVPGIRKLTEADLPVTLAVSFHAANDELRNELVPINRRHPIAELCDAMVEYRRRKGRRVSIEWAMIRNVNDRDRDADELAEIATRIDAHINLIPLNPTPGYGVLGSNKQRLYAFRDRLTERGAQATVRRTRGVDIDAACGQLAARHRTTAAAVPVDVQIQSTNPS